jgi:hypothetical protein
VVRRKTCCLQDKWYVLFFFFCNSMTNRNVNSKQHVKLEQSVTWLVILMWDIDRLLQTIILMKIKKKRIWSEEHVWWFYLVVKLSLYCRWSVIDNATLSSLFSSSIHFLFYTAPSDISLIVFFFYSILEIKRHFLPFVEKEKEMDFFSCALLLFSFIDVI